MTEERIVVIGASAGGVDALITFVGSLPAEFAAPICVVLHIPPDSPSMLARILQRETHLTVKDAVDGERYRPGTIYIACPDRHLVVSDDGTLVVSRGPRENRHRPAVDPLFRSAAIAHGRGAIGVVLSGTLDDGTAGLRAIKQRGGIAIVQDPHDALYPGMPQSALQHVDVDHVLPVGEIARSLSALVVQPLPSPPRRIPVPLDDMRKEVQMAKLDGEALADHDRPGQPSPYSCPDCGGVLWEIDEEGEFSRYRCRVGHAYSPESMLGAQNEVLEEALWTAAKTLEESARLAGRLAKTERTRGHEWLAERFEKKERDAQARVEIIRQFLASDQGDVPIQQPEKSRSR